MKKRLFLIKNIILNLLAIGMPMVILQIIILPNVSKSLGENDYGLLLSSVGFITMLSTAFGSSLNNSRLLMHSKYKKKGVVGDFNFYTLLFLIVNVISTVSFFTVFHYKLSFISMLTLLCASCFILLNEYFYVYFRIQLNYQKVLKLNIMNVIGYIFGWVLFYLNKNWALIYFFGSLFSLLYTIRVNPLPRETVRLTNFFKETSSNVWILFIVTLSGIALNYVDRLIIFPMFGGSAVSVYYCATLIGKLGVSVITPINNVILSYITSLESFGKNKFLILLSCTLTIGLLGYVICILISKPVLLKLYPEYALEAMKYVYITTFASILTMVVSVLNPFVLKFCKITKQLTINLSYLGVYFASCLLLVRFFGLMGVCFALLIAVIIKLASTILIYLNNN